MADRIYRKPPCRSREYDEMKTVRYNGDDARRVLVGMATDEKVIETIAKQWPEHDGLFASRWENMVGAWCVKHFKKFGEPIGRAIEATFQEWAEKRTDEETIRLAERFLNVLSDEHEREDCLGSDYLLELSEKHFNQVRIRQVMKEVETDLELCRVTEAASRLTTFDQLQFVGTNGLVRLSSVEAKPVRWLWGGWLAWGELSIVDADVGRGKTQILLDVAARATRGWLMPPMPRRRDSDPISKRRPVDVVFLSSEDAAETSIKPRFEAAGGDPDRLWVLGTDDGRVPMAFPKNVPRLKNMIQEHNAKLICIDPFYGFLEGKIDSNSDPKIRQAAQPLVTIAQELGVAFLLSRHLNKKSDENPLYRGGGSIGLIACCSNAIILGNDPENSETRVMAANRIKHAMPRKSLSYTIEERTHAVAGRTSRIRWLEEVDLEAADILAKPKKRGRPSEMNENVDYIKMLLAKRQTMKSTDLEAEVMERFDISNRTYKTARKLAGVKSRKVGLKKGWISFIPEGDNSDKPEGGN